jgi:hypothetical protein
MKKNILSDNIVSIIALVMLAQNIAINLFVLLREVKTTEPTTITILQNVGNMTMMVLAFYFVSSKTKQDQAGPPKPEITIKNEEPSNTTINSSGATQ